MEPPLCLKQEISQLAEVDFSKNWLIPNEKFVEVQPRLFALSRRTCQQRPDLIPSMKQAIEKINGITQEHRDLLADMKIVDQLLTFGKHFLTLFHNLPTTSCVELYKLLEKMEFSVIEQVVNQNHFDSMTSLEQRLNALEKKCIHSEAKFWVETARNKYLEEREHLENHPDFVKCSAQKILAFAEPGTYLLSPCNHNLEILLSYRPCKDAIHSLIIHQTLDGQFGYFHTKPISSNTLEDLIKQLQHEEIISSELQMTPIHKASAFRAATKIQQAFRGWKTRQVAVLPIQILPFLSEHLMNSENLLDIARGLCREINEMSFNPQKYRGKSVRLKRLVKEYPYHLLGCSMTKTIRLDFDCWLEMASDAKSITILLVPGENSLIGQGTYKTQHKGKSFTIDLTNPDQRTHSYQRMVRTHINKDLTNSEKTESLRKRVIQGFEMQRRIIEKLGPSAKIAKVPRRPLPNANPSENEPEELVREWFNMDLSQAQSLSILKRLHALGDVANTVKSMHENGFVYRDLKGNNILIKIDESQNVEGYLSDFDLASFFGKGFKGQCSFWDESSKNGWVTSFTDVYGLGWILAEILFPDFKQVRKNPSVLTNSKEAEKKLLQLVTVYLQPYVKHYRFKLGSCKNLSEIRVYISQFILLKKLILSNKDHTILNNLNRRLQAMESVFNFVGSLVIQNEKVYQSLAKDLEIRRTFALGNEEGELIEKVKAVKKIEARFPAFTVSAFLDQLAKVESILRE